MSKMYRHFKTDPVAESEGIVLDYGEFRITVARSGGANKRYLKRLEEASRPWQRAIQAGTFDNERSLSLLREVYADTIIRNWETMVDGKWLVGIEDENGGVIPVTRDTIIQTFTNLPDLFLDIMEQAGKSALYRAALREEAAKNL